MTRHVVSQVDGRCPLMIGLGGILVRRLTVLELDTRGLSSVLSVVPYYMLRRRYVSALQDAGST